MIHSTQWHQERYTEVEKAIGALGESYSVAKVAELTGYPKSYLYTHELIKAKIIPSYTPSEEPTNLNFIKIVKQGYAINITTSRFNKAFLYLVKNGKRAHRVEFKANGKNSSILNEYVKNAKQFTKVDIAMSEALDWINSL